VFLFSRVRAGVVEGVLSAGEVGGGVGQPAGVRSHCPENFLFCVIFIKPSHTLYVVVVLCRGDC